MKGKKAKKKAIPRSGPKPRNPHARALKESGLFRPKVVPAAKNDVYRRRAKHPKPVAPEDDGDA